MKCTVSTTLIGGFHESQCVFELKATYTYIRPLSKIHSMLDDVEVQERNCKTRIECRLEL